MKILLPFIAVVLFISCKEHTKTSTEKSTETVIKDSVVVHDTVAAVAPPPVAKANDTIVAGKSIGRILLSEKSEDVIKDLGKPDAEDAAMGKAMLTWYSKNDADTVKHSINVFTSTNFDGKDETPKVKHIRVTSPFFKTEDGVGAGSTLAFIKIKYPSLKKPSASYTDKSGKKVMIYDNKEDGIAFEINDATKCCGVTVHKPGQKAWETYISEFGDVTEE